MFSLLIGALGLAFNTRFGKAQAGTICIRADGSIDPSTAPISTVDKVRYILTGNITSDGDGILIERDNIVIDGAGCTLQGNGAGDGIDLLGRSNVTIKRLEIKVFNCGIYLNQSSNNYIYEDNITANGDTGVVLSSSSNNTVSGNNITANYYNGVCLYYASNNKISSNNVTTNPNFGVVVSYSSNNTISGNSIRNNYNGVYLDNSTENVVLGNDVTLSAGIGVYLVSSSSNKFYHNNFVDNKDQVISVVFSENTWDNGFDGNYWSDYNGTDANHDGIGDTLYVIDANNTDRYPLMVPYVIPGLYEIVAVYGSSPILDGTVNAGEWSDAASIVFDYTEVFVKQDGMNLYFGFNNSENQFSDDDMVVVAIDVGHDRSLMLQTDDIGLGVYRNGTLLEASVTGGKWAATEVSGWSAVVNSGLDMWQVEFNITYSKISVVAGVEKTIGVVFLRYRGLEGSSPNLFTWPPGMIPSYPADYPSTWGAIAFAGHNWTSQYDVAIINVSHKTVVGLGYSVNISALAANQGDYSETFNLTFYYGNSTFASEQWDEFWHLGDCNRDGYVNNADKQIIAANYGWTGPPDTNPADIAPPYGVVGLSDLVAYALHEGYNIWNYFLPVVDTETITDLASGKSTDLICEWNTTGVAYGNYTITVVASPVANETSTLDNNCTCTLQVHVGVPADVSSTTPGAYDRVTNMKDVAYMIALFNTRPGSSDWDPNADVNGDGVCNMKDVAIGIFKFNQHEQ